MNNGSASEEQEVELATRHKQMSPILSPLEENEQHPLMDDDHSDIEPVPEPKNTSLFIILAVGIGGLQIVYSVLYSHGLAHLRSLGLSKSQTAITFIAGPFCGIFVQPCFGFWSDHCTSSWGKRRPFIAFGGCALVVCLLGLAWTTSIVNLFLPGQAGPYQNTHGQNDLKEFITTGTAIVFTFGVYFASQPVQGGLRALIVDVCPIHQQQQVNAWVSLISGIANILGYLWAVLDLSRHISYFGNTQFKNLSVLASLSMAASLTLCCMAITEQNSRTKLPLKRKKSKTSGKFGKALLKKAGHTFKLLAKMPRQILHICVVQFFAWMGWYPYLLYVSTYLSDIYGAESEAKSPSRADRTSGTDWEYASRIGPFALLISSVVSVLTAISLPLLVRPPIHAYGESGNMLIGGILNGMRSLRPSLIHIWMFSHGLFALCMFGTLFVSSVAGTITIFGFVGISWAVATWIPHALLSMEISRATDEDGGTPAPEQFPTSSVISLHNVAICIPQVLISIGSSVYWKLQHADAHDPNSTGSVLRIGGVASLLALCVSRHVRDPSLTVQPASKYMHLDYEMALVDLDTSRVSRDD